MPSTCAEPVRRGSGRSAPRSLLQEPTRAGPIIDCANRPPMDCVREWFAKEGWDPFPFQEEVWEAYLAGGSGLIHAATGTGKTYAAWMGAVLEWLEHYSAPLPRRPAAPPVS